MARQSRKPSSGSVRIIAGQWRSRRIPVLHADGLRPTPDRVRETLFNWLGRGIFDANCLDLFAGSGALGLEALSRGAARATFIEKDDRLVRQLRANLATLHATAQADVVVGDALGDVRLDWNGPWDVVFVDPPYTLDCQIDVLKNLVVSGCLNSGARIYVESSALLDPAMLPAELTVLRARSAGQVRYHLLQYSALDGQSE